VALAVGAGVLSRHVLHYSLSFGEELTRYLFVWATFLGLAVAARQGAHLGLGGLRARLKGRGERVLRWALALVAAGFFGLLAVSGAMVVGLQAKTGQTTAALGMPAWWVGLAVPVGCGLAVLRELAHAAWGKPSGPDAAGEEPPAPGQAEGEVA